MNGTRIRTSRGLVALACAVALAVLAGCASSGGSGGNNSGGSTAAAAGGGSGSAVITIKDFAFTTPSSVSPGATVTVKNEDNTAHTVTADSGGAFDDPAPTGTSTFTAPTKPGSYPFTCSIHPEMHGTLVVK